MSGDKHIDFPIAVTDQATSRILVMDPKAVDWNDESAVTWSWSPSDTAGFEEFASAWGLPTDAKVRFNPLLGGQTMVVTDSYGLAAMIPYPAGDCKQWGANVGGNPHSAELLPDGNIAVAASTGGWVRVYAASQGPSAEAYAEYKFAGAHGVYWDSLRQVLWALGDDELVSLRIDGSAAEPVILEVHRTTLPSRHGHDLQPVCGDADRLWVSTGVNVYQYVKPTDTFESGYAGNEGINRGAVKSVGNQPSGIVVSTVPRKGGLYEWTTDQVDLFLPESKRLLSGAACYKARILNPFYEPRQPVNPAKWRIGASLSLNDWVNGRVDIAEWVRAGIHSVELAWRNDSFNLFEPANESQCSGWIDEIRKRGMDVWTLHLPYGPMFDISVTDSDRSREVIERHIRLMQMAHGWDIRTVVLHPSWEPIADDERPSRLAACKQALAVLAHEADLLGIVIAVECLPRTCLGNTSGEMLELISADSRLRICCDVNHLLQEAPEQFIRKLGQRVVTVHMSDCDGVDERHWMPGCGIIRWNETIRALAEHGYSGPFLFEIRQPVVSELVTCWNRLMADYMEAYE